MLHRLMYFAAIAKTHFNLGRVHVHIQARWLNLQIQRINRLALAVQHVFIRTACGMCEYLVAHKTVVHKTILLVGAGTRGVRNASPAPDPYPRRVLQAAWVGTAL